MCLTPRSDILPRNISHPFSTAIPKTTPSPLCDPLGNAHVPPGQRRGHACKSVKTRCWIYGRYERDSHGYMTKDYIADLRTLSGYLMSTIQVKAHGSRRHRPEKAETG